VSVQDVVAAGPLLLAMPVAVAAGVVSFASPCMLPLVPSYLSYLAGLTGSALEQASTAPAALPDAAVAAAADGLGVSAAGRRGGGQAAVLEHTAPEVAVSTSAARRRARAPRTDRRVPLGAALFVLGFTVVFVAYGSAFGALGTVLRHHERAVEQTLGAFTVVLGLAFAGVLHRLPWASRQWRPRRRAAPGLLGAPMLGVLFAVSWTPCIGPTLAAVQALALTSASAGRGAVLSAAYSLGLGIPFAAVAFGLRRGMSALQLVRQHTRSVMIAGGGLLVVTGLLELTGEWNSLVIGLRLLWPASNSSPL